MTPPPSAPRPRTLAILCTLAVASGPAVPLAHADNLHDKKKHLHQQVAAASNDYDDASAALVRATKKLQAAQTIDAEKAQRIAENVRQGADNIRRGQALGQLNAGLDPELVSAMTLGGMHQALLEALARTPRPPADWLARQLWQYVRGVLVVAGG